MKGLDKLREKLPAYPGKRIAILPLLCALASVLAFVFIIILDIIPRVYSDSSILTMIEPFLPLVGTISVGALGFVLIGQVWSKREEMKASLGDLAYQKMIPTGLTGVFLIPPIVFHAFTSIRSLPPGPPVNELTIQWSRSLLQMIGVDPLVDIWLRVIISAVFIILGAATVRSAILTFGFDYMAVVYLYFPEESEVQDNEIYSVIRHPTYLGGVMLGAAGLFFRFSVYSILFFVIIFMVFRLQIVREERELIERFGEGYAEYRKKVPALLVRPSKVSFFFRFLRVAE
ncbi:MAG: methyltransferase family protein [Promethearchaeota archaeon]